MMGTTGERGKRGEKAKARYNPRWETPPANLGEGENIIFYHNRRE